MCSSDLCACACVCVCVCVCVYQNMARSCSDASRLRRCNPTLENKKWLSARIKSLECACACACVCVFLLFLGGLFNTQRALHHSGCQGDDQRVNPQPTHTLTQVQTHTPCSFTAYKPEWILIVLNRAFTTQMLFRGLESTPTHVFPKQNTNTHTHTHTEMLKQTGIHESRHSCKTLWNHPHTNSDSTEEET